MWTTPMPNSPFFLTDGCNHSQYFITSTHDATAKLNWLG